MQDEQISLGTQVKIQEAQKSAPLNSALAIVVEIGEYDHAPTYIVEVYGAKYGPYRAYDFVEVD